MVERTVGAFGRIDILVNNAAIFATVPMSPRLSTKSRSRNGTG